MLQNYKNIYFLGIGGVGMSGLASWCKVKLTKEVAGYDRRESYFTNHLKVKNIVIQNSESPHSIPSSFLDNKTTLIVYTPAVSNQNKLYAFFEKNGFTIIKRATLLGLVSQQYFVIAIAGTHGKTTTSIMLAHVLKCAGMNVSALFGGVSKNYNANFLFSTNKNANEQYMVVEADEYDRSFLKLHPNIALITSLDKDHGDTYFSKKDMFLAYLQFILINTLKSSQKNYCSHVFMTNTVYDKLKNLKYVDNDVGHVISDSENISKFSFEKYNEFKSFEKFPEHNIQNAISAFKVAAHLGIPAEKIIQAFTTYQGVKRRFEYHVSLDNKFLIDDYAHHPVEIKCLISGVRQLHPGHKLFLIFQPHLYSRTRDLEEGFCEVLSLVDQLVLFDIYPAREKPISGVSSKALLKKINIKDKWVADSSSVKKIIQSKSPTLIVTAGAGDIDKIIPMIKKFFN